VVNPIQPGQVLGAYRLLALLGVGGMGEVWSAEHRLLGHRVAIKFLSLRDGQQDQMVERFYDEARSATQIIDPGVVQIYDFGALDGRAYIVMELLLGESLEARLDRTVALPEETALRLIQQVALTMAVAHGHGIVHRDLKPDNLFVVADRAVIGGERVKVLDFGIAKVFDEQRRTSRTQSGLILGTPMYMSPEQCRGAAFVDHRTDIYALGCVLLHALCGRPPFLAKTPADLIAAHLLEPAPVPSELRAGLSPAIDELIKRCLVKDPDDRFATMSELAAALTRAGAPPVDIPEIAPRTAPRIDSLGLAATSDVEFSSAGPRPTVASLLSAAPPAGPFVIQRTGTAATAAPRRRRIVATATTVLLIAAGTGGYAWFSSDRAPTPPRASTSPMLPSDGGAARAPVGDGEAATSPSNLSPGEREPSGQGGDHDAGAAPADAAPRRRRTPPGNAYQDRGT
jgi:eukaryotic-like serine/threonine-protein kinase